MPEGTTPPIPEGGLTLTVGVLFVDAMVADSRAILAAVGYGSPKGPRLDVGVDSTSAPRSSVSCRRESST